MPISSWKVRTLLAALAVDLERPVSPAVLAERLWDGEPPPSAAGTLQVYVSRLRAALRDAAALDTESGERPVEIVSRPGTYALRAEPEQIDWHAHHRLTRQARALVEEGEDREALDLLDQADDIWQGEPLAGLPGEWAQQTRTFMQDRWLAAQLTRSEIELRLGRYADLVPTLAELSAKNPWNERVAAHLMTALYGSGRIAEALATYRRIGRCLFRDLGTNPGEALTELNGRILDGANVTTLIPRPVSAPITAAPTTAAHTHRPGPETARRTAILPSMPELVGRDAELKLLEAAARGEWPARTGDGSTALPVVALSGLPGSGKTVLAVTAAHRLHQEFPDGTVLLPLGAHSGARTDPSPEAAATGLLRQFGVPAAEIPLESDELLSACRELLSSRRSLVILDDAAGAEQIGPLLPAAPSSFVLVTSRHRMAELPTVSSVPLDALTPDAAAAMFTRLAGPDRAVDPAGIAAITDLCSCHPLALHLAASRFRSRPSWTLIVLADRLSGANGRLDELRDGRGSLKRSFAMSYQALTSDQQLALRLLSLHPGGDFGPYAAAALIGCPTEAAERLVEDLLGVHLIEERTPERFNYHDLVREFAQDTSARTDSVEERSEASERLLAASFRALDQADRFVFPGRFRLSLPDSVGQAFRNRLPHLPRWPHADLAQAWLAVEIPGLLTLERQLRATGDNHRAAWFAHLLARCLDVGGFWHEALPMHQAASEHWRASGDTPQELHSLVSLSIIQLRFSRYAEAARTADRALHLARAAGDPESCAEALDRVSEVQWEIGEYTEALGLQDEVLRLRRAIGDERQLARSLNNQALLNSKLGNHEISRRHLSEVIDIYTRLGDEDHRIKAHINLGVLFMESGKTESARHIFAQYDSAVESKTSWTGPSHN
ncbi:BTAD domain-containing putative transcriptional regulator [Kitasatospora griseola]|uniref:BTAD domain-containing putative transcriptional regulator n=1 Tax=Kitasatospora griseola TaxID=2064 RepID=UPI003808D93C